MTAKWTRGELRAAVKNNDDETCREIVQYLTERGPGVVDWEDERGPCVECGLEPGRHQRWCGHRNPNEEAAQ